MARIEESKYYQNPSGSIVKETSVFNSEDGQNTLILSYKDGVQAVGAVEITEPQYGTALATIKATAISTKQAINDNVKAQKQDALAALQALGLSEEHSKIIIYG